MSLTNKLVNRILFLMNQKKLNQLQLFIESGVPESTISTILNKKVKTIKLETLELICIGLKISLYEFFNSPEFK